MQARIEAHNKIRRRHAVKTWIKIIVVGAGHEMEGEVGCELDGGRHGLGGVVREHV